MAGEFCWVEMVTDDRQEAQGFYGDLLGWTFEAIEALVLGARMVGSWCGHELAESARGMIAKVEHALPRRLRGMVERTTLFVPDLAGTMPGSEQMAAIREGIRGRRILRLRYVDADDRATDRTVRPVALFFWGTKVALAAWCELRNDFRSFRLDRIEGLEVCDRGFDLEAGRTVEDYLRGVRESTDR